MVGADRCGLRYLPRAADAQDVGGDLASHITFIVRDDDGGPTCSSRRPTRPGRPTTSTAATASTADRRACPQGQLQPPFTTRDTPTEDWLFNAEYPMVRWLERNGYDVSYFTDVDADRDGARDPRAQGLHVGRPRRVLVGRTARQRRGRPRCRRGPCFFSGNEIYWKTRWEPSTPTARRRHTGRWSPSRKASAQGSAEHWDCNGNFACDPDPDTWTGLWRQTPRAMTAGGPRTPCPVRSAGATTAPPPSRCRRPIGELRFWRNTSIVDLATGDRHAARVPLGYEWDCGVSRNSPSSYPRRAAIVMSGVRHDGRRHEPQTEPLSRPRAVRSSSARGPRSGRGASTGPMTAAAPREDRADAAGDRQPAVRHGRPARRPSRPGWSPAARGRTRAPTRRSRLRRAAPRVAGGNGIDLRHGRRQRAASSASVEVSADGGATWQPRDGHERAGRYTFTSAAEGPITVQARAVDDSRQHRARRRSVSFDVSAQACPCSIFDAVHDRRPGRTTRAPSSSA